MPSQVDPSSRVQFLGEITRGGMGAILKGRDPDLGRDLVVKVLLNAHCGKPDLVRRFVEEAQINCQLQHPGIVPVYQLGNFGDSRPYFTMKLVKGRTLSELLADRPRPNEDWPRFIAILLQVSQTVAYAHARRVIHRDLKPSNIMVGSFGEVLVMDWGLAKILRVGGVDDDALAGLEHPKSDTVITTNHPPINPEGDHSQVGSILGTPSYMAPEQARGEGDRLDERCDVFALGSILAEVLTGLPAFAGRNSGEIFRKSVRGDLTGAFDRLEGSGADVSLVRLAKDCLAAEMEDRPSGAQEVADRLLDHINSVHHRLREAELAQAAEHARADEAKRTASAESARAEEARRSAESAEARARAERQSRRLQVGLAASLIGLMTLGGGGFVLSERQKAERLARTARVVDQALAESEVAQGEAQSAPIGELGKWDEAILAIKRAEALLDQGGADAATRLRVAERLARLEGERSEAREKSDRIKADRSLLAELESIRGYRAVHNNLRRTNTEYIALFRKAGLDLDQLGPADARRWIASRSDPVELVSYLDDWASVSRRVTGLDADDWRRVVAASRAADPDRWRDAIRAKIGARDDASLAEFRRLADDLKTLDVQSAAGLVLFAREIASLGEAADFERATNVLRRAVARHPGDFWARFELGSLYSEQDSLLKPTEAVRHLTAATAIRPASSSAHGQLGRLLKLDRDQLDEAVREFREAIRLEPAGLWCRIELYDTLLGQGKLDAEIASCREANRLKPDDAQAHVNLFLAFKAKGMPADAISESRVAIELQPDMLLALTELGGGYPAESKDMVATIPSQGSSRPAPDAPESPRKPDLTAGNPPALQRGQGSTDKEVLDLVKDATVYIKLKAGRLQGSGSGFVMKVTGDTALIMTNRHVVVPGPTDLQAGDVPELSVVFRSGRGREQELPAKLLAYDEREVRDLAVLEVKGVRSPPEPISTDLTASETDLYETMPTYALGFPLGGMIQAVSGNIKANPAVTINAMSISSFRLDANNTLARIQLAGLIIQGNSGGPVVDAKGRLVGVVDSRLSRESVGFAIPPNEIAAFLAGDIGELLSAEVVGPIGPESRLKLLFRLVDPLNRLKGVSVRYARQSASVSIDAMRPQPGSDYPLLPGGTSVPLTLKDGTAGGTIAIPIDKPEDRKIFLQFLVSDDKGRVIGLNKPVAAILPDQPSRLIEGLVDVESHKGMTKWSCEANLGEGIKMTHEPGTTIINLPAGVPLNNAPQYNLFNAPCALVKVDGDFIANVEVASTFDPGSAGVVVPTGERLPSSFQSAGLLIWQDEKNFVRFERSEGSDPTGAAKMVHQVIVEVYKSGKEAAIHYIDVPDQTIGLAVVRRGGSIQLLFAMPPKQSAVFYEMAIDFKKDVFVGVAAANLSMRPFQAKLRNFRLTNLNGQEIVPKPFQMVNLVASGFVKLPDGTRVYEGAKLKVSNPADALVSPQDMSEFRGGWSEDKQLLWSNDKKGQTLTLELPVDANDKYEIKAKFTMAPDYAIASLDIDGRSLYKGKIDFYSKEVRLTALMSLGSHSLNKGMHKLTITVSGKNHNSSGYHFGIDEIQLVPVR